MSKMYSVSTIIDTMEKIKAREGGWRMVWMRLRLVAIRNKMIEVEGVRRAIK